MYREKKSVHSLRVEYTSSAVYGLVLTLSRHEYLPFYLQQVNVFSSKDTVYLWPYLDIIRHWFLSKAKITWIRLFVIETLKNVLVIPDIFRFYIFII